MVTVDATPEELEIYVLSALRSVDQIEAARVAGIREESFQVEDHVKVWQYLLVKAKDGEVPTHNDVLAVTGVELVYDLTDAATYQEDLIRRTLHRLAVARILRQQDELPLRPVPAIETIIGDLAELLGQQTAHNRYFDGGVNQRRERVLSYAEKADRGEVIGFHSGLPALDDAGDGWRRGEVIVVQGPLNVGKSTMLLWFCAYSYHHDRTKILFLTPETTIDEIELRLDPMIARFLGMQLSYRELRTGRTDREQWNRYCDAVDALGRTVEWVNRDAGDLGYFTVDEIIRLAREHRPDILAIDGVHLIRGSGKTWESMKEAAEKLKGLAQSLGIVILGGTQVQRDAVVASDDTADLSQSAYGMAFVEAADKVISLAEKRGDPLQRVWKLPKNRTGRKLLTRQFLRFDVDHGIIGDLRRVEHEETGFVEEVDL